MSNFDVIETADRASWLAARRSGVGASDVAGILGVSPWTTPFQVWVSKVDGDAPEPEADENMEWGLRLEDVILDEAETRLGPIAGRQSLIRSAHPGREWMMATPDGFLENGEPVEAKKVDDWDWPDGPPQHYRLQVLWQIAVTGAERGHIVALHRARRLAVYTVERDEATIEGLIETCGEFWASVHDGSVPPEVSAEDSAFLASLWPQHVDEEVEVDGDLIAELRSARAEFDAAKRRKDAAEAALKDSLGEASTATFDGAVVATWKTQQSRRIDSDRLRKEFPDVAAECTKVSSSRVLRVRGGSDV